MKKFLLYFILLTVILCSGCASKGPKVTMHAVCVSEFDYGSKASITLQIKEKPRKDTDNSACYNCSIQFTGDDVLLFAEDGVDGYRPKGAETDIYQFYSQVYYGDLNSHRAVAIYILPDMKTCVIDLPEDGLRYVASVDAEFDANEILELYAGVLS